MRQELQKVIEESDSNNNISLKFICVAMRYSFPMIEDNIDRLLERCLNGKKISIEIAMVAEAYLRGKNLHDWALDSQRTSDRIEIFRGKYHRQLTENKLQLDVYIL